MTEDISGAQGSEGSNQLSHKIGYASPVANETSHTANVVLVIGTVVYLLLNGFGLMLVMRGTIMPPWGVLGFFSICPLFLIVLVGCLSRAFKLNIALLIAFAVIMVLAAAFNVLLMGEGMASI